MKILIVEDDEDKRDELIHFLKERSFLNFSESRSFQSTLKKIKEEDFDLILLDMSIPTYDISPTEAGGRSQAFGGEMILYELLRRKINTKVIVVTQFDIFGKDDEEITIRDLDEKLEKKFKKTYLGIIQYSISYTSWKELLYKKIINNL